MRIRQVAPTLLCSFVLVLTGAMKATAQSPYLLVWTGDEERRRSDFLAVIDTRPGSKSYGQILTTLQVNATGTMPHHTEYEFPDGGILFANGWATNQSFIFDVSHPMTPVLKGTFGSLAGYDYPHSFVRLPNGHVLGTFQGKGGVYAPPGGLVEIDEHGRVVRSASVADPSASDSLLWPYSIAVVPKADRLVVSNDVMGFPNWVNLPPKSWSQTEMEKAETQHIQVWSLSDLKLLSTIALPASPSGSHEKNPSEPRLLPDGSVYVNTFNCGLFHVHELAGKQPTIHFVLAFPGGDSDATLCGVPVVVGKFWIQPVAALPGLIVLDVSDPEHPKEVSRLQFEKNFQSPHWVAADRKGSRLVVTGNMQTWVLIVNLNMNTGKLFFDQWFLKNGMNLLGPVLGEGGRALPHGALFASE